MVKKGAIWRGVVVVGLPMLVVAVLFSVWYWRPGRAEDLTAGRDREWRRRDALDRYAVAWRACEESRRHLVAEVAEGHLPLREAAAQLRQLYEGLKQLPDDRVGASHLPTDEAVLCRDIILRVDDFLQNDPERSAVRSRLEEEYRQDFPGKRIPFRAVPLPP